MPEPSFSEAWPVARQIDLAQDRSVLCHDGFSRAPRLTIGPSHATFAAMSNVLEPFDREANSDRKRVICIDMDGTLVRTDVLWTCFVDLLTRQPLAAMRSLTQVRTGVAYFKRTVASLAPIEPSLLPYRNDLLDYLRDLAKNDVHLVLATANDSAWARAVAAHLNLFHEVIASDGVTNLKGRRKAVHLVTRFGARQFDYFGDSGSDLSVWAVANERVAVGVSRRLGRHLIDAGQVDRIISTRPALGGAWVRAVQPSSWLSSLLILFAFLFQEPRLSAGGAVGLAILSYCCCASAGRVLASIFDVAAVRRLAAVDNPFVTGELQISHGTLLVGVLCAIATIAHIALRSWVLGLLLIAQFLVNYGAIRIRPRTLVVRMALLVALCLPSAVCGALLSGQRGAWLSASLRASTAGSS